MKFLHTSDWHLGASEGEHSLREDQVHFIEEICRIVEEKKVDAVLIAGDVYDRSVASAEAIKLYDEAMTRICMDLKTPVLMIAGNHDSAERLSTCSELLSKVGLHVQGALEKEIAVVSYEDTDVYLLPWITEAKVKSIYPEKAEEINSLEEAYQVVLDAYRKSFVPGKKHLIVAHAYITGAETSTSDHAAEIGTATQVSASVFDDFDYVALGHIHKPSNVTETIRYSGTPMPYSFGKEETQVKSVTIIDTDTMEREIVPLSLLHKRTTLEGNLDDVLSMELDEETKNGYIRLKIADHYVGLETLSRLRETFPQLLDVSGKTFEGEESGVKLTMEELEKLETDPLEVFRYFCREVVGEEADEHLSSLFSEAVAAVEGKEEGETR